MKRVKAFFAWMFAGKRRMITGIFLILLLGFTGFRVFGSKNDQVKYQTDKATRGTIVSAISASGTVLTANISNISTSATGVVSEVYVKDGDKVASGQKLADLIPDTVGAQKNAAAWASYLSAKNAADSANVALLTLQSDMFVKWDEFKALAEGDLYENADGTPRFDQRALPEFHIAQNEWLAAEQKYKNQQAVIVQFQAALNSSWLSYRESAPAIFAPVAGTIANITLAPGMTLVSSSDTGSTTPASGRRVAVIKPTGKPLVSVNLSEIDVPRVALGQKATVVVDALTSKTFTGAVVSVDRIGSVSSGVVIYPAIIGLDTETDELLPNMAVTANIILETKTDALLVPSSAVQTENSISRARVLENGREMFVPVETGISSDTETEIISGLKEGDEVVTGTAVSNTSTQTRSVFSGGFGGGTVRMVR